MCISFLGQYLSKIHRGANIFPFQEDLFLEGVWYTGKLTGSYKKMSTFSKINKLNHMYSIC